MRSQGLSGAHAFLSMPLFGWAASVDEQEGVCVGSPAVDLLKDQRRLAGFAGLFSGFPHFPLPHARHSAIVSAILSVGQDTEGGFLVEDHGYRIFTWFSGVCLVYLVWQSLIR